MKWGIIGPGNIARDFVKDFKQLSSKQEVVAVLNHRKKTADEFAEEFGVKAVYTDLDKFIKHPGIEIAYVATPHTKHYHEVKACLEAGIHVLCEKPMGINYEQYESLYALAKKKKRYLLEGMWLRFLPQTVKLQQQLDKKVIGKVFCVKATLCFKAPKDPDSRYFNPDLGGGSLLDLGIYTLFLAIFILGKPDKVRAVGHLSKQGIDNYCSILLGYKDGRHALLESSLLYNSDQPAVVIGDKGQIDIAHPWFEQSGGLELRLEDKEPKKIPVSWRGHGLHFQTAEVLRDIKAGRIANKMYSPKLSLDIIEVMDEIREQLGIVYDKYE